MELRLSTSDVSGITGVPVTTLHDWCTNRWVVPTNNGQGTGRSRGWSLMQTVAAYYANQIRLAGIFSPTINAQVLDCVSKMSRDELLANIARGETFILPMKKGCAWLDMPKGDTSNRRAAIVLNAWDISKSFEVVERKVRHLLENAGGPNGAVKPA